VKKTEIAVVLIIISIGMISAHTFHKYIFNRSHFLDDKSVPGKIIQRTEIQGGGCDRKVKFGYDENGKQYRKYYGIWVSVSDYEARFQSK